MLFLTSPLHLRQIPACLQDFEGIMYSATCWLDESQSWLSAPCSFATAKNLQSHANSLQVAAETLLQLWKTL